MESIIDQNGFLVPRYYQIIQDRIESKQAMEPVSIAHGGGAITGFNIVDTTKNYFSITGDNNPNISLNDLYRARLSTSQKHNIITINNLKGKVVNSHFTPSGLLSIDPNTLNFPSLPIDWSNIDTNPCLIILKAKLTYSNIDPITQIPSSDNFEVVRLNRAQDNSNLSIINLANLSYEGLLSVLHDNGCDIYEDTEVLIGLYQIGYNTWDKGDANKYFFDYYKGILPWGIIPIVLYGNRWPVITDIDFSEKALLHNNQTLINGLTTRVEDLENFIVEPITGTQIEDNAIGFNHLSTALVTYLNEYQYIITNNTELLALNNRDIKSALIKKGTYTLDLSIKLHDNLKLLTMEPGAIITINNGGEGFYKDIIDYEARYIGLNINMVYGVADTKDAWVFKNLCNMYNCKGFIIRNNHSTTIPTNQILTKVYNQCNNLIECLAKVNADITTMQIVESYHGCKHMLNCQDISLKTTIIIAGVQTESEINDCLWITGGTFLKVTQCRVVDRLRYTQNDGSCASLSFNNLYLLADTPAGGFNTTY